jgi:hypothetical protein
VRKRQRRFEGFDEKILALYSRGLSTRDIESHLADIYGVKVGRDLISQVTDAVIEDVKAWQQRPLDDLYPVLFLDALVLKIRDGGSVQRKACYLAMAINLDGQREVLGMWFSANRGRQVLDAGPERAQAQGRIRKPGAPGTRHAVSAVRCPTRRAGGLSHASATTRIATRTARSHRGLGGTAQMGQSRRRGATLASVRARRRVPSHAAVAPVDAAEWRR